MLMSQVPSTMSQLISLWGAMVWIVVSNVYSIQQMLEQHLGNSFMEKEEIDKKTVIRANWKKLIKQVKLSFNRLRFKNGLRLGSEEETSKYADMQTTCHLDLPSFACPGC